MSTDMRLNQSKCLSCGEPLTGATCASGNHDPSPGDIKLRAPTTSEEKEIASNLEVAKAKQVVETLKKSRAH